MARASRADAERHRASIEAASARLFLEHGRQAVTVARVMADAGLTHGGFYGHFASKDELLAVACQRSFEETARRWAERLASADGDFSQIRHALLAPYLTTAHRDDAREGCAAAALTGDVAREAEGKPVRAAYVAGVREMVETWRSVQPDPDNPATAQRALAEVAMLIGAISMARATSGDPLSDAVIEAVRHQLLDTGSGPASPAPDSA
ncbi:MULTISPECIES: TetR/AcrR family transcriptional regulator [unclassified Cupriavidus]|uniref:TetR/AcrR family transcriptional regulator n=1 Tax=Cupriavidus sp. H19C3 TaxID=3241603 RepID=UPI003BF8DC19